MKMLYVYADFDWLNETELVGELGYESLRGSDSYCFTFSDEWLKKHGDLFLSDDSNIRNRRKIYSDVSRMLCRIVGDERCCCDVSRLLRWKRGDRYGDYLLSIF